MGLASLVLTLLATSSVQGFTPVAFSRSGVGESFTQLYEVIRADAKDFEYDPGRGGVRLAKESAIKLLGSIKHGPGKATPEMENLLRYKKVTEVQDSVVKSVMDKEGWTVIATGMGQELYKDPGETTVKEVTLAPHEAVKDALMGAASVTEVKRLVVNFLGGDDLMSDEVRDAMAELVLDMSPPTKAKIKYNSLCHSSFPLESATVTVIATTKEADSGDEEEETGGLSGAEASVANGEVYFRDGKWFTVVEDDINTAIS